MRPYAIALLLVSAVPAAAQKFGAAENLAPYIPTPEVIVDRMLDVAHIKAGETVYDLGSGDGRVVIAAAEKYGARAVGVEIRPDLCRQAEARIKALGLEDRVKMVEGSALRVDLSPADVVTMYFLTTSNERLKPNLEHMKAGSRVVSNEFPVKGWKPVEVVHVKTGSMEHTIYVYQIGHTH
ncbi:MAG TPA: methyltransferase domain-containing protein [Verrucomicrobiae bacterium]|nr:methyltransferase domain-containing protein [Verrucomicrobiae bacterium]